MKKLSRKHLRKKNKTQKDNIFDKIEVLLALENFEELDKVDQKLISKYYAYKKARSEKQKYIEKEPNITWCIKGQSKVFKSDSK